jgi:hypothetical protein
MARLVRTLAAAAALGLLVPASPPAVAGPSAAALHGSLVVDCWGCGDDSRGWFTGDAVGMIDGQEGRSGTWSVGAEFTVTDPQCVGGVTTIEGSIAFDGDWWAWGTFTGTIQVVPGSTIGTLNVPGALETSLAVTIWESSSGSTGWSLLVDFAGGLRSPPGLVCGDNVHAVGAGTVSGSGSDLCVGSCPGARNVVAFDGTWRSDCFGCGSSDAEMSLSVTSAGSGGAGVGQPAWSSFTANEPADATCLLSGSASGHISGAIEVDFNWTRLGPFAVISMTGHVNGIGTGTFTLTSPIGLPCTVSGATAIVTGQVAGI